MHEVLPFIIAIKGRPGLYQLVKPVGAGVLVERLGERAPRFVIAKQQPVTPLDTVTLPVAGGGVMLLADVLAALYAQHGPQLPVGATAAPAELRALLCAAVPTCDPERVLLGALQKLVSWYPLLADYLVQTQPPLSPKQPQ